MLWKKLFLVLLINSLYVQYCYGQSDINNDGPLQCNPSTKHLFGKFFMQRFFDARTELGMEDWKSRLLQNPAEYSQIAEHVIVKFFSWSSGTLIFYRRNNSPILYTRIWKCANEGIGMNLHQLTVAERAPLSKGIVHEAKTQASLNAIVKTMYKDEFLNSTDMTTFTFVREPFSKFISGLAESVFRTSPRITLRKTEPLMVLNVTTAKKIFHKLLDCQQPLVQLDHIYPMSGALFEFNVNKVGHLERFKKDWDMYIRPAYQIQMEYNEKHGAHPTSEIHPVRNKNSARVSVVDPSHVRPTLRLLFEKEIKYKRALCHLLLIDYICLPEYPLPYDCLFLNATLTAAREALLMKKTIPHMMAHLGVAI
mmetsp:Transcript_3017/g.4605  ORF Transcript_3017/g.4605 Transcript_3017/m.4605 type:complete len:366 (-) Transcript_3017:332-1429(-)